MIGSKRHTTASEVNISSDSHMQKKNPRNRAGARLGRQKMDERHNPSLADGMAIQTVSEKTGAPITQSSTRCAEFLQKRQSKSF